MSTKKLQIDLFAPEKEQIIGVDIVDGVYTVYIHSDAEKELVDTVLGSLDLYNRDDHFTITQRVLTLPINKQLHFIQYVLDNYVTLYSNDPRSLIVDIFLAQSDFNLLRRVLLSCAVDSKTKIKEYENQLEIKIVNEFPNHFGW